MMIKILAFFLLLLSFQSHAANWIWVKKNDAEIRYIDTESITLGKTRQAWMMVDYIQPQIVLNNKTVLSIKYLSIFACGKKQYATSFVSHHSGNLASGDVINSSKVPIAFKGIISGTVGEDFYYLVCGWDSNSQKELLQMQKEYINKDNQE